ncbi:Fic family protein [Erythrobacter sp. T5W1-R]|uniref:Fic family protein n=1 Tax=Erythrobacter sp. T5W1-R TaxID=3101752 RepID=UPI002AFE4EE5|nr:Fic family protein [Erythrobacter sp. T5W1-R]MEA1618798.1 Fic family protein [Erythrobacter sp. T5W1-R]
MIDDNWDLITGEPAHAIEVLNYSNQVNVIEALVHLMMFHKRGADNSCSEAPPVWTLREFHRTATLFLLLKPGEIREEAVLVVKGGVVVHQPPRHDDVHEHLEVFNNHLKTHWASASVFELAAYSLWMINWIHPFKNGNGRTARAFAYAVISLKLGFILPGQKTLIDLIMDDPTDYYTALGIGDKSLKDGGAPNLKPMIEMVDRLLAQQLSSI